MNNKTISRSMLAGNPAVGYDFTSLQTVTVGTPQSTITFSSIPATYKHLQIRALAKSARTDSEIATYKVRFNGDGTSIYSYHRLLGSGAAASASGGASTPEGYLYSMAGSLTVSASTFGVAIFDILDYANTNKYKVLRFLGGSEGNAANTGYLSLGSVSYQSTNAITSISFDVDGGSNFTQYSSFALYGIK